MQTAGLDSDGSSDVVQFPGDQDAGGRNSSIVQFQVLQVLCAEVFCECCQRRIQLFGVQDISDLEQAGCLCVAKSGCRQILESGAAVIAVGLSPAFSGGAGGQRRCEQSFDIGLQGACDRIGDDCGCEVFAACELTEISGVLSESGHGITPCGLQQQSGGVTFGQSGAFQQHRCFDEVPAIGEQACQSFQAITSGLSELKAECHAAEQIGVSADDGRLHFLLGSGFELSRVFRAKLGRCTAEQQFEPSSSSGNDICLSRGQLSHVGSAFFQHRIAAGCSQLPGSFELLSRFQPLFIGQQLFGFLNLPQQFAFLSFFLIRSNCGWILHRGGCSGAGEDLRWTAGSGE